jgi:transposase
LDKSLKVTLSERDKKALLRLKRKRGSNIGIRAFFVLLNGEGKKPPEIAKQTGYSTQTVRIWIKRYQAQGITGLFHKKAPGRPPIKSDAIKLELNTLLENNPFDYGYQDAHWTTALLVDYFSNQGLIVSRRTVERALRASGWRYKRLSKVPPNDKPTKAFKKKRLSEIIAFINEAKNKEAVHILFGDESHFSTQPYVQRAWGRVGEKNQIMTVKKRESCTIFGALNAVTQKCYWKTAKKGNAGTFIEFLRQLKQTFSTGKIMLILDNASIHRSKKVQAFLKKNTWIEILHIPPYSPELNPIERFWGWLKAKIYSKKEFSNLNMLIKKVRKLMWHYNEDRLVKRINFEFEMYKDML